MKCTLPGAQVWNCSWKISWPHAFRWVWWPHFWAWPDVWFPRKPDWWKQWMACNLYRWWRIHDADRRLPMAVKNQNLYQSQIICIRWWYFELDLILVWLANLVLLVLFMQGILPHGQQDVHLSKGRNWQANTRNWNDWFWSWSACR